MPSKKKTTVTKTTTSRDVENPPPPPRGTTRTTTTTTTTTTSTGTSLSRSTHTTRNYNLDTIQLCFLGQIFCALVLLLVMILIVGKGRKYYGYGMAVAIVAMIVAFIALLLYSARYDDYGRHTISSISCGSILCKLLVLWWFIAAIILTFGRGPFTATSNGYFAVWIGLIFAVGAANDGLSGSSNRSALLGMMLCSIILIIAIPDHIGKTKSNHTEALYTLLVSIFTILLLLVVFYLPTNLSSNNSMVALITFSLFAIAWIVVPFLTTFRGPFIITGNGYFASWIGALCSVIAAATTY